MRKSKAQLAAYFILRGAVLIVLLLELLGRRWTNVFLCVLTLFLFMIPSMIERRWKVELPGTLEIIVLMFIFAAEILGEIGEFYVKVDNWDTLLHTLNGFLMAAIGFSMIDVLNRSPRFHISLSPAFVAFVAFCFSMTIGVLWEFFEYAMDKLLLMDMQKDFVLQTISSVSLNPEGANVPVVVREITDTVIHSAGGGETVIQGGYLDIGINDTMKDLLVNCVGAVVFSVLGGFYVRHRGGIAKRFIPKLLTEAEAEEAEANYQEERRRRKTRKPKDEKER